MATGATFDVGVLADERLRLALEEQARSHQVEGRPVRVRGYRNLDEVELCPVLFVGRDKARLMRVILDHLEYVDPEYPMLTIGERDDFLGNGGVVRLVERADRIAFEVNLAAAGDAGLRVSSELLRLAERVIPAGGRSSMP
jgi:hypothetical protein